MIGQDSFEIRSKPPKRAVHFSFALIIPLKNNKRLCHRFNYYRKHIRFECSRCRNQGGPYVYATVIQRASEEYFVKVFGDHKCTPIPFETLDETEDEQLVEADSYYFFIPPDASADNNESLCDFDVDYIVSNGRMDVKRSAKRYQTRKSMLQNSHQWILKYGCIKQRSDETPRVNIAKPHKFTCIEFFKIIICIWVLFCTCCWLIKMNVSKDF